MARLSLAGYVLREAERLFPGKDTLPLIINISGGQFSRTGQGHPLLADAVKKCAAKNVLIVAAAGNEGCDCLHVPGSLPSVLVAGAMDSAGVPLPMSNWGAAYRTQGILAPGENILGAMPGGGAVRSSGTSFAAPVVSGVAALLLSLQLKLGQRPDPQAVRKAILDSAAKCDPKSISDCRQYLAGVLNIDGAMSIIRKGEGSMAEQPEVLETLPDDAGAIPAAEAMQPEEIVMSSAAAETAITTINDKEPEGVNMAQEPAKPKCACGQEKWSDKFVYVIGQLGVDFVNQARQDSLQFESDGNKNGLLPITQPINFVRYLRGWEEDGQKHAPHMYDAKSVYWTLWQDGAPIYIVQPMGPFADDAYRELVDFYADQIGVDINSGELLKDRVERVAISGVIVGEAKLSTNEMLPIIVPHMRGTASWSRAAVLDGYRSKETEWILSKDIQDKWLKSPHNKEKKARTPAEAEVLVDQLIKMYTGILERLYEETRNFGITPEERAVNYSCTNVFDIIEAAKFLPGIEPDVRAEDFTEWQLDSVDVKKSKICRADSDCYDVEVAFYDPENLQRARRVAALTVDVSDVVPVRINKSRYFSRR